MSENIQSISNGSFVLGQTSATNFQAGPGISIDSPSEGVVRIGNDETVLWSGTASSGDTMQLSEPFSGFHYLEIYGSMAQPNGTKNMLPACKVYVDDVVLPASFNIAGFSWWGNINDYKFGMCIGTYASSYSSIKHIGGVFLGYWDSGWQVAAQDGLKINRVIGINRISGSNA